MPEPIQPTPPAGEDVHQAAAEAWLTVDPDGPTAKVLAGHRPLVAAVNRAAQLTRQQARDEMRANLDAQLIEANATINRAMDALGVDHPVWMLLDDYDGSMDNIKALVAETEQRVRAETAARIAELERLVGETGQPGWDGCSRAEAIRQATAFQRGQLDWMRMHDERRGELDAARDELREARLLIAEQLADLTGRQDQSIESTEVSTGVEG